MVWLTPVQRREKAERITHTVKELDGQLTAHDLHSAEYGAILHRQYELLTQRAFLLALPTEGNAEE